MHVELLPLSNLEQWKTRAVLKETAEAHRDLAEVKSIAASIPNKAIDILNNSLIQTTRISPKH